MSIKKLHLTRQPKCKLWSLQKMGVLILSCLSLPAYANDDGTLLRFSMQVGSIMYTLVIVSLFVSNTKVRMMLLVVYLFVSVSAYLFGLCPVFELTLLLTIFVCSIIPLLSTIVLVVLAGMWNKPNTSESLSSQ